MGSSARAHQLAVLLRAARELDIIGDVSVTVDSSGELVAWARLLTGPQLIAWRAEDTGRRYLCLTATQRAAPVRGQVAVTLDGDRHRTLWDRLLDDRDLPCGTEHVLDPTALYRAWTNGTGDDTLTERKPADE